MNKQIIFSLLLIASTTTYGMKRKNNNQKMSASDQKIELFTTDTTDLITQHICINHNYWPFSIRKDIRALSGTNTYFHDYYAQEQVKQNIIRLCSRHKSNDKDAANNLKCRAIEKKIEQFTNIALNKDEQFSKDDLKETWYLNMTTTIWSQFLNKWVQQSLLQVALNHSDTKKVIQIIDHGKKLDFCYERGQNLLLNIAQTRNQNRNPQGSIFDCYITNSEYNDLLEIAKRLLQKNFLPDGRETIKEYTPLMNAVKNKDKELARLLLEYGADPYAKHLSLFDEIERDAFDFPKGSDWFQEMVNEVAKSKNNAKECA